MWKLVTAYPGYFIIPVRVNWSAVKSYFSQLKFATRGQLSSVSYEWARAAVETCKAALAKCPNESDYKDVGIDV